MQPRSAKAKGKNLERAIRLKLLETYPDADPDRIRVTIGQETGSDVKIDKSLAERIPLSIEAKNRETFGTLYKFFEQAKGHVKDANPLLVLKSNHKPMLAVIDFDFFLDIFKKAYP
jgi:succinyl-CoA synthetase beta subunit